MWKSKCVPSNRLKLCYSYKINLLDLNESFFLLFEALLVFFPPFNQIEVLDLRNFEQPLESALKSTACSGVSKYALYYDTSATMPQEQNWLKKYEQFIVNMNYLLVNMFVWTLSSRHILTSHINKESNIGKGILLRNMTIIRKEFEMKKKKSNSE